MDTATRSNHAAKELSEKVVIHMDNVKEWAIVELEAPSRFLVTNAPTSNMRVTTKPLAVTIPDSGQINTTHTCTLAIPQLLSKEK